MIDTNNYSKIYDTHRKADLFLIVKMIAELGLSQEQTILDFGCGTGNYLVELQKLGFFNLYGLDKSAEMREKAFNKTGLTIKIGTHLDIPYDSDFFDVVISIDMLHFIEDLNALFRNLFRVCKTGGQVFIATQSHRQVEARFYNKYFHSLPDIDKKRYHDPDKIIGAAEMNGFTLVSNYSFMDGSDMVVDEKYFSLIQNKSFFVLRMLQDDEFAAGIEEFRKDMDAANSRFIAKFAGRTLLTFRKADRV